MNESKDLFADFPPGSKADWLEQVVRELRGEPLDSLNWRLDEEVIMPPFFHPDDELPAGAPFYRATRQWEIGAYVDVLDVGAANKQLLSELQGGVEAPLFRLKRHLSEGEMEALLSGVALPAVSVQFGEYYVQKEPAQVLARFRTLARQRGEQLSSLRGSLDFDPLPDFADPPIDLLSELVGRCAEEMPAFRVLQVNANRFHTGAETTVLELAYTIAKGSEYLAMLADRGLPVEVVNRHLLFAVEVGGSYFVEIAKLRALRLLWANVLAAYGSDRLDCFIEGHVSEEVQTSDPNSNMIRAGAQALCAVIGGVDRLYVPPANAVLEEHSTPFYQRVARNVQQLLRLEASLDRVMDPGAGSYYLEELTRRLAAAAWKKFQEMEGEGGYLGSL